MRRQTLTRKLAKINLIHYEKHTGRSIEIEVFAPDGSHFTEGPHSMVFSWKSGTMAQLRAHVAEELEVPARFVLTPCPAECECSL